MIKRFKKLYRKDDSYDYYLNTLTSRVGNNEYKNSLNVNNIIPLYGETVSRNNFANSQIGEFILRYTKARDEKTIKRVKKLYQKDDSYDYYLNTITSKIGNNEYKNTLNVNNMVTLYRESIPRNNYNNSHNGEFKELSYNKDTYIKPNLKNKKLIMNEIRKGLMTINLND
jgi:hypothetical protein